MAPNSSSSGINPQQQFWLLWAVFLMSTLILNGIIISGMHAPQAGSENMALSEFQNYFSIVCAIELIAIYYLRGYIRKKLPTASLASLQTPFIVGLVCSESMVILGFILGFLFSYSEMLPFSVVGIASLISFCPRFLLKN